MKRIELDEPVYDNCPRCNAEVMHLSIKRMMVDIIDTVRNGNPWYDRYPMGGTTVELSCGDTVPLTMYRVEVTPLTPTVELEWVHVTYPAEKL